MSATRAEGNAEAAPADAASGTASGTTTTTTMKTVKVMLGSSSKWRAKLVAGVLPEGFELFPEQVAPDIDEKAIRRDDPHELVTAIAQAKTDRLLEILDARPAEAARPDVVICADQVIVFDGTVREKPVDAAEAKSHLQSYGAEDKPAECTTGLVVTNLATRKRVNGVDVATQAFKPIPDDVADALIAKGDIMYCAGSFVAEDPLLEPYLGERNGEMESVQGMPVRLTQDLLRQSMQTDES
ncbi:Maf-like protein DDB_G0281937 [Hondaea fermentalgiana]|uniref:Maf-like protein DDB_G0281937 n=1 Tax=Hondaea fermentalgiana TaxID=2315210 RepID=A0A2R5GHM7_9STRA|nr:Maf-like protein DDB_G0281937 [Hondaea fermentalgiana]|eukprot:GBG27791.1 Maf-like protein DDB_G0281937 [Hondaea fermentalgiana]